MRIVYLIAAFAVVFSTSFQPNPVSATSVGIIGNKTDVRVTAPLGALGLSGSPFGTATVDTSGPDPVFSFPITGGTLNAATSDALIEHEGSGVTLSNGSSVTVGNFLIDTKKATVFGDVIGGPKDVDFFKFGKVGSTGVKLLITDTLAGALTDAFNAPDLSGAEFGLASPDVKVVPVPAALPLFLSGLAGIGLVSWRRKQRA